MRLVRYLSIRGVAPGMLDDAGKLRDLSYVLADIDPACLTPDDLDIMQSIEPATLPPATASELAAPLANSGRIHADFAGPAPTIVAPNAEAIASDGGYRAGIAAVVGAGGRGAEVWSGAFMAALALPAKGWLALGPWLWAPGDAFAPDDLQGSAGADGDEAPFALPAAHVAAALRVASAAVPGDIVLATLPLRLSPRRELRFGLARFGTQTHRIGSGGHDAPA